MNNSKDEHIEKPLWERLFLNLPLLSRLGRCELLRHEASLVAYSLFAYALSFVIPRVEFSFWGLTTVDAMHFSAFSALLVAYFASINLRLRDKFNIWPTVSKC